jgi:hypothetical protein
MGWIPTRRFCAVFSPKTAIRELMPLSQFVPMRQTACAQTSQRLRTVVMRYLTVALEPERNHPSAKPLRAVKRARWVGIRSVSDVRLTYDLIHFQGYALRLVCRARYE